MGGGLGATSLYLIYFNWRFNMKKYFLITFSFLFVILFISCTETTIEPDPQFVQIFFKYGFNNELNTFNNTYKKDLVLDGSVTVTFWLTADEQNRILAKANEIDFFTLPDTLDGDSLLVVIEPNPGFQTIRIKSENNDNIVNWTEPVSHNDPFVIKTLELYRFIISIIEAKPEYKKLPQSRGSYL